MKTKIISFVLIFYSWQIIAQEYNLSITVSNIKEIGGQIQIGLYNDSNTFPDIDKEFLKVFVPVDSLVLTYIFENLATGEYAVALYHDTNNDSICNRNFLGIPKEDFGFSNNIKPILSAPSFKKTKVLLTENKEINIRLQ